MEALNADAIRAAMPTPPISGGAAADRIADALGTPNVISEKANVTAFVVRRFVDRGLLVDLSANPDGTLHHPDQVAEVCRREDLADLVAADTPLGPEQAAARLRVRRADFDHVVPARMGPLPAVDRGPLRHQPGRSRRRRALHHGLRRRGARRTPRGRLGAAAHRGEGPALSARIAAPRTGPRTGVSLRGPRDCPRSTPSRRAAGARAFSWRAAPACPAVAPIRFLVTSCRRGGRPTPRAGAPR